MKSLASFLAISLVAATGWARPAPRGPDFVGSAPKSVVPRGLTASPGTAPIDPFDLVHFDFDSARIPAEADDQLDAAAQWLMSHRDYRLVIEGHTDRSGPAAYNEHLAQWRAQAVYESLTARGVEPDRLMMVVYGENEARPVIDSGDRQVAMFASRDTLPHLAIALLDHRRAIAAVWTSRGTVFSETRNPQISLR